MNLTEKNLYHDIITASLGDILDAYPLASDFFANMRIRVISRAATLGELVDALDETVIDEFGMAKQDIPLALCRFLMAFSQNTPDDALVSSLTILGGHNKFGEPEDAVITLLKGEVSAIVGPTGSGKSRLLADIECLAQCDTPTNRRILINGQELSDDARFDMDGKLVAQLSQNMNFIMDLTVREFLEMHARSRFAKNVEQTVENCMACANSLAGEYFTADTKVTLLSGGQSRALMIADTAYMSSSPLVLIDEIENAGIDRKRAIKVLTKSDKIVLIATHDPLLALSADKRIVIKNGGIYKVIGTTDEERGILEELERMDNTLQRLRNKLRTGELITDI
jgi:ABC-type lipoprotein export system ATPase subunit